MSEAVDRPEVEVWFPQRRGVEGAFYAISAGGATVSNDTLFGVTEIGIRLEDLYLGRTFDDFLSLSTDTEYGEPLLRASRCAVSDRHQSERRHAAPKMMAFFAGPALPLTGHSTSEPTVSINSAVASALVASPLTGWGCEPIAFIEQSGEPSRDRRLYEPDRRSYILEFRGRSPVPFYEVAEGKDACGYCGFGPLVCKECGYLMTVCFRCGQRCTMTLAEARRTKKADSHRRVVSNVPYPLSENPPVVDLSRWDGADFMWSGFDFGVVTRRAFDWLVSNQFGPFDAVMLPADVSELSEAEASDALSRAGHR